MTRTLLALAAAVAGFLFADPNRPPAPADPATAHATQPASRPSGPFAVVMVDAKTEKALGPFPYDRSVLARAVEKAAAAGARGIVIKFFLDRPKSDVGDRALAEAMTRTKVILQAGFDDAEERPNDLPDRFVLGPAGPDAGETLSGDRGMIPIPLLASRAHAIGFIDNRGVERLPLVERYRGRYVKSLFTCCLELATGQAAAIEPGKAVRFGTKALPLDARSEAAVRYPAADDLPYIPLVDLLDGPPRPELKDRVVILGWDGDRFAPIRTPMGDVRPHRVFCYALMSLYDQIKPDEVDAVPAPATRTAPAPAR